MPCPARRLRTSTRSRRGRITNGARQPNGRSKHTHSLSLSHTHNPQHRCRAEQAIARRGDAGPHVPRGDSLTAGQASAGVKRPSLAAVSLGRSTWPRRAFGIFADAALPVGWRLRRCAGCRHLWAGRGWGFSRACPPRRPVTGFGAVLGAGAERGECRWDQKAIVARWSRRGRGRRSVSAGAGRLAGWLAINHDLRRKGGGKAVCNMIYQEH